MPTFRAIWVSNVGRTGWQWGTVAGTPAEAVAQIEAVIDRGEATMGFVVRLEVGHAPKVLVNYTRPTAVQKIVRHYESLLSVIEQEKGE